MDVDPVTPLRPRTKRFLLLLFFTIELGVGHVLSLLRLDCRTPCMIELETEIVSGKHDWTSHSIDQPTTRFFWTFEFPYPFCIFSCILWFHFLVLCLILPLFPYQHFNSKMPLAVFSKCQCKSLHNRTAKLQQSTSELPNRGEPSWSRPATISVLAPSSNQRHTSGFIVTSSFKSRS